MLSASSNASCDDGRLRTKLRHHAAARKQLRLLHLEPAGGRRFVEQLRRRAFARPAHPPARPPASRPGRAAPATRSPCRHRGSVSSRDDRRLAIRHLDDVIAELRLHETADFAGRRARTPRFRTPPPCGRARNNPGRRPARRWCRPPNISSPAPRNRRRPSLLSARCSALALTSASFLPSVFSRMWLARICSGVV